MAKAGSFEANLVSQREAQQRARLSAVSPDELARALTAHRLYVETNRQYGARANLQRANLIGADLDGLALANADLGGADLRQADLRGTLLSGAILTGADLTGANFFKAVLDGADLSGANLVGARFLDCAQLTTTRNWQSTLRGSELACGSPLPLSDRS